MELIKNDTQWFLSEQGGAAFAKCQSLEDRAIFIYSYLKTIAAESLEKDSFLFRMAFLLADEVAASQTEYAAWPALLDSAKNPFIAYIKNAKRVYDVHATYCILLSILHGLANPFHSDEWIYDRAQFEDKGYIQKLKEIDRCFIEANSTEVIDSEIYAIDPSLRPIQIEIAWLFILAQKEGK